MQNVRNSKFSSRGLLDDSSVDLIRRHVQSETLVRKTHLLCKGGVGLPGRGVAGVCLFHHLVDLFEGEAFGFGLWRSRLVSCRESLGIYGVGTYDKEVGKCSGDAAKGTPQEKDLCTEVRVSFVGTDQVGGNDGNDLSWSVSMTANSSERLNLRSSRTNWTR